MRIKPPFNVNRGALAAGVEAIKDIEWTKRAIEHNTVWSRKIFSVLRDHNIKLKPEDHRRNITTRDVPLNHLVGKRFKVGEAILEATRLSTPCRHIEQITGLELFNQLANRSGLNAKIIVGGEIFVGDTIKLV